MVGLYESHTITGDNREIGTSVAPTCSIHKSKVGPTYKKEGEVPLIRTLDTEGKFL